MRLMSFKKDGRESFGIAADERRDRRWPAASKRARLCATRCSRTALPALRRLASEKPDLRLDDVEFLPPIADARKLLCIGINYVPHMKEMGRERPEYPVVFVRFADSIVGHGQPMIRPSESVQFDYEGELAVVIGRRARRVSRAARSTTSRATRASTTAACATTSVTRSSSRPARTFTRAARSGPGS